MAVFHPTFLLFDGHRIELADESVDRIVFRRASSILNSRSRTGRELMAALPVSVSRAYVIYKARSLEMRNHKCAENDIDPNEIFGVARGRVQDISIRCSATGRSR
jgi:hypothetical protein